MSELLAKVLPLALGAAISPTSLAALLVVLSGRRPIARGAAFVIAWLSVLAGLSAIGLWGVRSTTPSPAAAEVAHAVDAIAGVLLLLLALGTVLRAALRDPAIPATDAEPADERRPGLWGAFLLGLAMMVTNLSTILLYLPAMHEISIAHVARADEVVAVIVAFLVTSLPVTAPYTLRLAAPGVSTRAFARLHDVLTRHQRQIGVAVEVLFGVWLLVKAVR